MQSTTLPLLMYFNLWDVQSFGYKKSLKSREIAKNKGLKKQKKSMKKQRRSLKKEKRLNNRERFQKNRKV